MRFSLTPLEPFGLLIQSELPNQEVTPEMLRDFRELYPLVLFRGFNRRSRETLLKLCADDVEHELLQWSFGPVMEMKEDPASPNYLFSSEAVPIHWDGAFHKVPSYLVFDCVQAPPTRAGGETLFTNTKQIVSNAADTDLRVWRQTELSYETEHLAHYGGEVRGPLLTKHPRHGFETLRFAEPVHSSKNPVRMSVYGANPQTIVDLTERIYHRDYCYEHRWREGDLLIADNHCLLHGRRSFTASTPRHLRRVQIL